MILGELFYGVGDDFWETSISLVVRTELCHQHHCDYKPKYSWLSDPPFYEYPRPQFWMSLKRILLLTPVYQHLDSTINILIHSLYQVLSSTHPFCQVLSFQGKKPSSFSNSQPLSNCNLNMKRKPSNTFQALGPSQRMPCWFARGLIMLLMTTSWDSDSYISAGNC